MKFRIEKGVAVHARYAQGIWSIGRWSHIPTERAVEFDLEDVWFAPVETTLKSVWKAAVDEPDDFRKRIDNTYYMINYYGFHLPKNRYSVEQIVVPMASVEVISDPAERSHISEQKKLERKVKMIRGNYTFTGN